jgi:hypothetical protein
MGLAMWNEGGKGGLVRLIFQLAREHGAQIAEHFKAFDIDIIVIDHDTKAILEIGQERGDRHGIEFRKGSEEGRVVLKFGNAVSIDCKNIREGRAQCRISLPVPLIRSVLVSARAHRGARSGFVPF